MNKIIRQIRDLDLIEKELNSNHTGVFAFSSNEKICQFAATYIYLNKNVYVFINETEELHLNIKLNSEGSFTIIKYRNQKQFEKENFKPLYSLFSISITGILKSLTEQKIIDDVSSNYLVKYGKKIEKFKNEISSPVKIILIDTQEIQAFEEIGG
jgi:hypothetical protein